MTKIRKFSSFLLVFFVFVAAFFLPGYISSNGSNIQKGQAVDVLADVTDGEDDTYEYYVYPEAYRGLGIQAVLDGGSGTVTLTVEASLESTGAVGSRNFLDVTEAVFGTASYTDDCMLLDDTSALSLASVVKVKIVSSTGDVDDADWKIIVKQVQ